MESALMHFSPFVGEKERTEEKHDAIPALEVGVAIAMKISKADAENMILIIHSGVKAFVTSPTSADESGSDEWTTIKSTPKALT